MTYLGKNSGVKEYCSDYKGDMGKEWRQPISMWELAEGKRTVCMLRGDEVY